MRVPLLKVRPVLPTTTPVPKPPPCVGVAAMTLPKRSAMEKLVVLPSYDCSPKWRRGLSDGAAPAARPPGWSTSTRAGFPAAGYAITWEGSMSDRRADA